MRAFIFIKKYHITAKCFRQLNITMNESYALVFSYFLRLISGLDGGGGVGWVDFPKFLDGHVGYLSKTRKMAIFGISKQKAVSIRDDVKETSGN